ALSVSGKPCEAAALYQICRQKDPARAYSWHYEGFNLDRCGRTFAEVYPCLVQAVELDPENPWWNGRLVTFLIRHARFDQARDRFAAAMSRIRQRDAWFSRHFLRWVAHQWLESGQPLEAERVFSQIDQLHVEEDRPLRVLRQQILDAVEALHLGDSVYAPNYPIERRWKIPAEIPAQSPDGHPLTSWYPFRVQELSREGPVIVLATTDPARRVLRKTLTPEQWEDWLGEPWTEAAGFYFAGVYADQTAVIRATPPDTMVPHTLSYDAADGYWRSVD
ncbi:tetratricopeptide repeat protein, partial [bacterium CPR1]|nr:tetratricopeptide repeat protein [bacterium CPR1]